MGVLLAQMFNDRRVHALRICQDLMVPEPQNPVAFISQEAAALRLWRRQSIVLPAIDFDNQACFVTNKIDNVASKRHLTAESAPVDLTPS